MSNYEGKFLRHHDILVVTDDSHLLCKSQHANSSGYCQNGMISLKKGMPCIMDDECPANGTNGLMANTYASC